MKRKKIVRIVESFVLIVLIACVGCNIITGIMGKSHIFGYKPMFVMSGSMEPTIKTYQLVLTKPVSSEELQVNDIATYKADNGITVIHRIVEITDEGIVFKGDHNAEVDKKIVTAEQIGYKVVWY